MGAPPSGRGSRGGARTLTPQRILEVATRIGDEEGTDALTIRRIATELGTGAMTLYNYFRNKEEILDGIADYVMGSFRLPEAEETSPRAVVREIALALLQMMREHPSIVRLFTTRVNTGPESMEGAFDSVIGRLREVGFGGADAVRAYGLLMHYTLGFASYQVPRPWGPPDHPEHEELQRQRKHFYAALPMQRFPNLVELSAEAPGLPSDEQFLFGLECLIEGLVRSAGVEEPNA